MHGKRAANSARGAPHLKINVIFATTLSAVYARSSEQMWIISHLSPRATVGPALVEHTSYELGWSGASICLRPAVASIMDKSATLTFAPADEALQLTLGSNGTRPVRCISRPLVPKYL